MPFHFWGLGFKIRLKMLPRASQITVCQPHQPPRDEIPVKAELYPVTLSLAESLATLKIILANITGRLSNSYRNLNEILIEPQSHLLVYVPFVKTNLELIHPSLNISFLKNQFRWIRSKFQSFIICIFYWRLYIKLVVTQKLTAAICSAPRECLIIIFALPVLPTHWILTERR